MRQRWLAVLACMLAIAGCSPSGSPPAAVAGPSASAESPPPASARSWTAPGAAQDRVAAGLAAYERACARCHEEGLDDAPVTGRPEDWAHRSRLWQAVLVEHAEKGYFDMPAKGGDSALSDAEVQAAAEHMLTRTHPQPPAG
jgi:cytochrome c5